MNGLLNARYDLVMLIDLKMTGLQGVMQGPLHWILYVLETGAMLSDMRKILISNLGDLCHLQMYIIPHWLI